MDARARRLRAVRAGLIAFAFASSAIATGCDLAGADIHRASASLGADFGTQAGSIPPLACSASSASACAAVPAPVGVTGWQVGCDTAVGQCFGQADYPSSRRWRRRIPCRSTARSASRRCTTWNRLTSPATIPTNTLHLRARQDRSSNVVGTRSLAAAHRPRPPAPWSWKRRRHRRPATCWSAPSSRSRPARSSAPNAICRSTAATRRSPRLSEIEAGKESALAVVATRVLWPAADARRRGPGRSRADAALRDEAGQIYFDPLARSHVGECRCVRAADAAARDCPAEQRREHVADGVGQRVLRGVGKGRGDQVLEDVFRHFPANRDRQQRAQAQAQQAQDCANRGVRERVGV